MDIKTSSHPTIQELQHAHQISAKVVAIFGDAYLPIFERVHKELESHQKKMEIKMLALKVASNDTSFRTSSSNCHT